MISVNNYKKNINRNYLFEFFTSLNFTQIIWMTYFAYKGLTLVEIGLAESIFHMSSLVMEIPTGAIADLYGRKVSRLLGVIAKIIYLTTLIFVNSFVLAAVAMFLAALSYNLESGADTAFVYDTLVDNNAVDSFTHIQGNREVVLQVSSLIGIFIGGLIAERSYTLAILAAILVFLISFMIGSTLVEPKQRTKEERPSFKNHLILSYKEIIKQPKLIVLMIFGSILLTSLITAHYYISIYWLNNGVSLTLISFWFMIQSSGSIIGGLTVSKLIKKNRTLWVKGIGIVISLCLWVIIHPNFGFYALFLLGFLDSLLYVTLMHIINESIQSHQRATLLSVNSMFFSVVMIVIFPLFGYIAELTNLSTTFSTLAVFTGIIALILTFMNIKNI